MDIFDLFELAGIYTRIKTAPTFWLDQFYTGQINFEGKEILFEKVFGDDRKLAPFALPTAQGRPSKLDGFQVETFAPAYIKQKDVVDATMHLTRRPGEALGGTLSIEQRRDAVIAELVRRAKVKIRNRWNWLAARATIDAKVVIEGEDYPSTLVDFRRDPALTKILAGGAKWDQTTADPLADLKEMRIGANELSGARIQDYYFGGNAWELFCQRVDLKELMNQMNRGAGQNTRVTLINEGYGDTIEYMGSMSGLNGQGQMNFYVDTTRYIDPETGTEEYYLDTNTVAGVSPMMEGVRCFAAIMDADAQYKALEVFFKNWRNMDPSVEYILSQSAPLMVPKEPNATFSMKVA